jgi:ATP-dependent DNA helicase RecQ
MHTGATHSPRSRDGAPRRLGTLADARAFLQAHFGYPDFRPPQIRAVESVLSGRDTLIVLPTGGGKSLCYQVPALLRDGLTIVVSPLISLMKDQVEALQRRGLAATFLNSTLSAADVSNRMARLLDGSTRLLYLAPERLDATRMLETLATKGVALLAVDEAHCISEWGHDFRPSYRRIGATRERLGTPQTVALTATATPDVRRDIVRQLVLRDADVVVGGFDRTNLTYHVERTPTQRDKDTAAVTWLRKANGPAVVYAPTRKAVERVTSVLLRARVNAVAYHAGLDDERRQRAQDAFMRERVRVIVATSAFGMGIDKPDVRLVVHHAMPGTLEAYYQEAGRAGRDGLESACVLLHSYPDRFTHEFFIGNANPARALVEQVWRVLRENADADNLTPLSVDAIAERCLSTVGAAQVGAVHVGAAIRVLTSASALTVETPPPGRVWVRLLAAPARIISELCNDRHYDREVLRVFWRAVGNRLHHGASIDLDGLPPGLGGASGVVPVLERLESEQFVMWMRKGGGFRLDPRYAGAQRPPVDWVALDRRRQTGLSRLEAMQQYAQTRYCRRAYVLRYFGDPHVRSHCHACDRCLSSTAESSDRSSHRASRSGTTRSRPRRL